MSGPHPADHAWWLASRASGIVALLCMTASVVVGLALAARVPALRPHARALVAVHQQTALIALVGIAVHGITLLGDSFLRPGIAGIAVPFVNDHERVWTGLGVTGGWLAAILGLSYWLRERIGPRRWRALHRATILAYALSIAHTLGSGTDAGEPWMRLLLLASGAPVLFLLVLRMLPPPAAAGAPAFRRLRVGAVVRETANVVSLALESLGGDPLPPFAPGQFLTVRLDVPGSGTVTRSYSLSGPPGRWRISVKHEPGGAVSGHVHERVRVGDVLEASGPHGAFVLDERDPRPVVLASAGIGATPVLAMLAALAERGDPRPVWWAHGARSRAEHAFRGEARALVERLPAGRAHVRYSREGEGRLTAAALLDLGVPRAARFYLCGPTAFVDDLRAGLLAAGVASGDVASESFGGAAPTPPAGGRAGAGVEFVRSGVTASWDERFGSLLELAEAHAVAAPSACRVGACHACKTEVLAGAVDHDPVPAPGPGQALLCCARPGGDVRLDL